MKTTKKLLSITLLAFIFISGLISVNAEDSGSGLTELASYYSMNSLWSTSWSYAGGKSLNISNKTPDSTYPELTLNVLNQNGGEKLLNSEVENSYYAYTGVWTFYDIASTELATALDDEVTYEIYASVNLNTAGIEYDPLLSVQNGGGYTQMIWAWTDGSLLMERNYESGSCRYEVKGFKLEKNKFYHIICTYGFSDEGVVAPVFYIDGERYDATLISNTASGSPKKAQSLVSEDSAVKVSILNNSGIKTRTHNTWVMSKFYKGIISDEEAMTHYLDFCDKNSQNYSINVKNNDFDADFQSLKEGKLEISINSAKIADEDLNSENIKLKNSDGDVVALTISNHNSVCTLSVGFIDTGAYTLTLSKNIKSSSGNSFRLSDKIISFDVSENNDLRLQLIGEINYLFADESKSDETVGDELIEKYNYILMLDISDDSEYSTIINKPAVFGMLRKKSYASFDDLRDEFIQTVTLQAKNDIEEGITEFNAFAKSNDLSKLKNVIFVKYESIFKLSLTEYEKLSDKDEAIKLLFDKNASSVEDVSRLFAEAVEKQAEIEKKAEFINGLKNETAESLEKYLKENSNITGFDFENEDYKDVKDAVLKSVEDAKEEIKSLEKLKEVYYSSLLLNGLNSVEVGEREKTERLLNDYSDWWTEPSNYKNASSDERTVLYTALTDGRTYSDIADIGTQIESEMKKIQGDNSNSSENKNQKTDKKVNSHKSSTKSGSFSADSSVKKEDIPATKVEPKTTFTDISDVSWAVIPIETLYEKGIVNGRSATKFAPNDFVTRAEFSKLLAMALEISSEEKNLKFTDVSEEDWCYDSINSLYNAGIVTGISDNVFGKDDNLTRAAMAAMLERALDYKELIEEADEEEIYDKFADDESIPEYAKKSVYRLRKNEIINGVGGNMFDPMGYVTRAQAAKAIYTILNLK